MRDWQDIESAPKDGTVIDLWVQALPLGREDQYGCRIPDAYWVSDRQKEGWWDPSDNYGDGQILQSGYVATHWMSVPGRPTSTEDSE